MVSWDLQYYTCTRTPKNIQYIHWERTAPHPVVLNWDSFLCSVCCILHYLSVCITADRAGGERLGEASQIKTTTGEGEGAFRSQRIYTLYVQYSLLYTVIVLIVKRSQDNRIRTRAFCLSRLSDALRVSHYISTKVNKSQHESTTNIVNGCELALFNIVQLRVEKSIFFHRFRG